MRKLTTHQTPGVYIEEISSPIGPIEGVGTSTVAMIGATRKGPINVPTRVTSWTEFEQRFGEGRSMPARHLVHAVRGFFDNGGKACYVTRITGAEGCQAALSALEKVPDVNLICLPGRTDVASQAAVVDHCERQRNRLAILDSPRGAPPSGPGSVLVHRAAVESQHGYAALYYPWIRVKARANSSADSTMLVPPSGHLAGIFARTDAERGVHKAPANEVVRGAIGLERVATDIENAQLNDAGVNVLRIFAGREGPVVWGGRTTAPPSDTSWRYVNVRRLIIFVEESIANGLDWPVFEPNDLALWDKLRRIITTFLTGIWRSGALPGRTADDAFYVRIDEALNTTSTQLLGLLIIEIGVAPMKPAEFVVIRFAVRAGGVEVTEA